MSAFSFGNRSFEIPKYIYKSLLFTTNIMLIFV